MSNFDFLKGFDDTLWKLGNRIEKNVSISPSGVKADATTFLEHILKELLTKAELKYNSRKPFTEQLDKVFRSELKMSYTYKERIRNAYNYRNKIHDEYEDIEKHEFQDAIQLHEKLFYIARKFYRDYNDDYDQYKGVPNFKPLELDLSPDEVKIRDLNENVDVKYDYCVVCGEPNHLNYSIYCHKCSRRLENSNNFISVRNAFGKDAEFTKEDLIEYGMQEAYVNQFINSLVRENMLKVAGRFITFNNLHLEEYLSEIDKYIAIGELITRFKEDKITPEDIKKSREYMLGSRKEKPFYQFYKITNREIIKKFEKDLLTTEDIWRSIDFTGVDEMQLKRWYKIHLGNFKRGDVNESFVVFNQLLQAEYLKYKRQGLLDKNIKDNLNVTSEIYDFWVKNYENFNEELGEIKKELLLKSLSEGKTADEAIEIAGVTQKEFKNLVKYSEFKDNEFSQSLNREFETRKRNLIEYLKHNDLPTSCELAKLSLDDFYKWYEKDVSGDFYLNTTEVLMHNFLNQRRKGLTKLKSAEAIGLEYKYVEHWFKRTLDICKEFQNKHIAVIVGLAYDGFKKNKSKAEIAEIADVSVNCINAYLEMGQRGYGNYKALYDYYEENILPNELNEFLNHIKNKPLKKALEMSDLTQKEFDYCCSEGSSGNLKYKQFYQDYYDFKLNLFLTNINKGKSKSKALRNADLSEDELNECYALGCKGDERFADFYSRYYAHKLDVYTADIFKGVSKSNALKNADLAEDEIPEDIDEVICDKKIDIIIKAIKQGLTTKQMAKKANVSIEDIYNWFLKGREGDEKLKEFAEIYYDEYVSPGAHFVQMGMTKGASLNIILKTGKGLFTREDYDFWLENGFLKEAQEKIDEDDDDDSQSIFKEELK